MFWRHESTREGKHTYEEPPNPHLTSLPQSSSRKSLPKQNQNIQRLQRFLGANSFEHVRFAMSKKVLLILPISAYFVWQPVPLASPLLPHLCVQTPPHFQVFQIFSTQVTSRPRQHRIRYAKFSVSINRHVCVRTVAYASPRKATVAKGVAYPAGREVESKTVGVDSCR